MVSHTRVRIRLSSINKWLGVYQGARDPAGNMLWLRWLRHLPWQIISDSVRLLRPRGQVAVVRMPVDDRAAALRGFAALVLSTSPGDYVIKVVPDENTLLVHRASGRGTVMEREVTR